MTFAPAVKRANSPTALSPATPTGQPAGQRDTLQPWWLPATAMGILAGLALLPRVQVGDRLWQSVWAALGVLLLMLVNARYRASRRGGSIRCEFAPVKAHYVQLGMHSAIYAYWGLYWSRVYHYLPLLAIQIAFLYAFDMLLCWSRRDKWTLGFGPFPIVLSTNLFLWFKDDWFWLQLTLLAIAALGKEFIRWTRNGKRTHIFNPYVSVCDRLLLQYGVDAEFRVGPSHRGTVSAWAARWSGYTFWERQSHFNTRGRVSSAPNCPRPQRHLSSPGPLGGGSMSMSKNVRTTVCALALASLAVDAQTVVGGGYAQPVPIPAAPGQLMTIYVQGIGASLTSAIWAQSLPLPTSLAGISVTLVQTGALTGPIAVPLLAVFPVDSCPSQDQPRPSACSNLIGINLQIPFELKGPLPEISGPGPAQLAVSENGRAGPSVGIWPRAVQIHILRTGDTITRPGPSGIPGAAVTHANGSLVSPDYPAQPGETVSIYAVGLAGNGPTGNAALNATRVADIPVSFDFRLNAAPSPPINRSTTAPAWLTAGNVGLYQINVTIPQPPSSALPCSPGVTNLTIDLGDSALVGGFPYYTYFDGAAICVAVPPQGAQGNLVLPQARRQGESTGIVERAR